MLGWCSSIRSIWSLSRWNSCTQLKAWLVKWCDWGYRKEREIRPEILLTHGGNNTAVVLRTRNRMRIQKVFHVMVATSPFQAICSHKDFTYSQSAFNMISTTLNHYFASYLPRIWHFLNYFLWKLEWSSYHDSLKTVKNANSTPEQSTLKNPGYKKVHKGQVSFNVIFYIGFDSTNRIFVIPLLQIAAKNMISSGLGKILRPTLDYLYSRDFRSNTIQVAFPRFPRNLTDWFDMRFEVYILRSLF